MKSVSDARVIASTNTLTISGKVSIGGGPHQAFTYRLRLKDLRDDDVIMLCEAMGMEVGRRVRQRWDELEMQDMLPIDPEPPDNLRFLPPER